MQESKFDSTNNYAKKYKDIEVSSVDIDSQCLDRKILEIVDDYENKIENILSMHLKEYNLANNNDEELVRRTKIKNIQNDLNNDIARVDKEFEDNLKEAVEKYKKKEDYPFYSKLMFIGASKDYEKLLCGLWYFLKIISEDRIQVYYDAKFSEYLGEFTYKKEDWRALANG